MRLHHACLVQQGTAACHPGHNQRKYRRRTTRGSGNRRERTTSRATIRVARRIAVETKKPWSMPTSVGSSSESRSTSHPVIPRPSPVFARTRWWRNFLWSDCALCDINPWALEARRRRLSAGVVDAEISFERRVQARAAEGYVLAHRFSRTMCDTSRVRFQELS